MPNEIATSADWLKAGIELFACEGIEGLRPDRISQRIGTDRSDFFRYFHSEEEFLQLMLEYWRHAKTTRVIETFGRVPTELRIEKLVDMVFADRSLHDFLFHLRKLGTQNKAVARLVAAIEEERINSTRPIFNGLGLGQYEIDMKVEILYSFYLGWYERNKDRRFTPALRTEVLEQIKHLLHLD